MRLSDSIVVLVYFFVNSFLLPHGLLLTMFFTPLFMWYNFKAGTKFFEVKLLILFAPFLISNLITGVDFGDYVVSWALFYISLVFGFVAYHWFQTTNNVERYFSVILLINTALVVLSILVLFTPLAEIFWTIRDLTNTIESYPRLQLLTYEPSYYSTLLAPIVLYYIAKLMAKQERLSKDMAYLFLALIPIFLSFSFGVIFSVILSVVCFGIYHFRNMFTIEPIRKFYMIFAVLGLLAVITLVVFPFNPVTHRIIDLFSGNDTSGKGRTVEAIYLAYKIIEQKSVLFGIGLGQLKIVGEPIIREYYNYSVEDIPVVRIPSAIGETLAVFGVIGLVLRLGLQIFLFYSRGVYLNVYRSLVFIYIFIYQFTGSYLTNIAEYVLWAIAFSGGFANLDFSSLRKSKINN